MNDSPEKIQWHPAFYAAAGLELMEDIEKLELRPEYNLSKEPIRIDLLVIKNDELIGNIKNEIGHIMRKYNVIEYKSPEDGMTIDDFYKTVGYACLYKGYGDCVDQIPIDQMSISLFREIYPEKLFLTLKKHGHKIEERYPGIYYVTENLPFPAQIVVTKQLNKKEHRCLRILSSNAEREDIEAFLMDADKMKNARERNNIDAVLQASVSANYELYQEIRRDLTMCEALRELMKDEIDRDVNKARAEARAKGEAQGEANIIINMEKNGVSLEDIAKMTGKEIEDVKAILEGKILMTV